MGNFCFYRKVERVYKVALREDELEIANVKPKLHTEQVNKLHTNILNSAQCSTKNILFKTRKIAIRYLNFAFSAQSSVSPNDACIAAMKTTSYIRAHKIEKIRNYLKRAHPLTCLRSCLQFNSNRR